MKTALEIGHSNRVFGILQAILEEENQGNEKQVPKSTVSLFPVSFDLDALADDASSTSSSRSSSRSIAEKLDEYVKTWTDDEIEKVFVLLRDWNTNAKHSFVSTMLLSCLLRVVGVSKLSTLRNVKTSLPGLLAYSERHYQRISRLVQATYLSDYFSSLMQWLPAEQEPSAGGVDTRSLNAVAIQDGTKEVGSRKRDRRDKVGNTPVLFAIQTQNKSNAAANGEDDDEVPVVVTTNDINKDKKKEKSQKKKRVA